MTNRGNTILAWVFGLSAGFFSCMPMAEPEAAPECEPIPESHTEGGIQGYLLICEKDAGGGAQCAYAFLYGPRREELCFHVRHSYDSCRDWTYKGTWCVANPNPPETEVQNETYRYQKTKQKA